MTGARRVIQLRRRHEHLAFLASRPIRDVLVERHRSHVGFDRGRELAIFFDQLDQAAFLELGARRLLELRIDAGGVQRRIEAVVHQSPVDHSFQNLDPFVLLPEFG